MHRSLKEPDIGKRKGSKEKIPPPFFSLSPPPYNYSNIKKNEWLKVPHEGRGEGKEVKKMKKRRVNESK